MKTRTGILKLRRQIAVSFTETVMQFGIYEIINTVSCFESFPEIISRLYRLNMNMVILVYHYADALVVGNNKPRRLFSSL